jgi:membrane protease subunit (stomatin/prohibitin family)
MSSNSRILVFVYNADSGAMNLVKDFWKKMLKPSSYECNLCMQTFGTFGVKKDWKKFINSINIETEFIHKDEFEEKYDILDAKFPSAYLNKNGKLTLIISSDEMNSAKSLDEMEALVLSKIK